jgi:hypothetical protein
MEVADLPAKEQSMTTAKHSSILLGGTAALLLASACHPGVVSLGGDGGSGGEGNGAGVAATTTGSGSGGGPSPAVCPAGAETTETWTGYVENGFTFPSGSGAVSLTLSAVGGTTCAGTIRFGGGPLLPPPTNPKIGYPPYVEAHASALATPEDGNSVDFEGFVYPVENIDYQQGFRLQFKIFTNLPWSVWCKLQTPYKDMSNAGQYNCLPNEESSDGPNGCTIGQPPGTPVDCGQLELCQPGDVCQCTAQGCSAAPGEQSFDLAIVDNQATATVAELGTIRLLESP